MNRYESVYGNIQKSSTVKKAVKSKQKYIRKFGDDSGADYSAEVLENAYIGDILGVKNIEIGKNAPGTTLGFDIDNGIIVGNIRMGFGHYRISMAMASAANSMGLPITRPTRKTRNSWQLSIRMCPKKFPLSELMYGPLRLRSMQV